MHPPTPPEDRTSVLDADVARQLDQLLAAEQPGDAELLARVRGRVLEQIAAESQGALHTTVRASDQPWEHVAQGIERKLLFSTPTSVSSLVRLAPGASVPGHVHTIHEECLVLEGTLRIGTDLLLKAGDFHVGMQGVPHATASTQTGAVVFLREGRGQAVGA
jgi:quercetin dioxygenase-like cupin family protein